MNLPEVDARADVGGIDLPDPPRTHEGRPAALFSARAIRPEEYGG